MMPKKMAKKLDQIEFEGKFLNAILLTWVGFSKFNFGSGREFLLGVFTYQKKAGRVLF